MAVLLSSMRSRKQIFKLNLFGYIPNRYSLIKSSVI